MNLGTQRNFDFLEKFCKKQNIREVEVFLIFTRKPLRLTTDKKTAQQNCLFSNVETEFVLSKLWYEQRFCLGTVGRGRLLIRFQLKR